MALLGRDGEMQLLLLTDIPDYLLGVLRAPLV